MRCKFLVLAALLCGTPAMAQTAPLPQGYVNLIESTPPTPRLQRGRQVQKLQTDPIVTHNLFAQRLGQISAITGYEHTIFTADRRNGQIFRITDRNGDGRSDGPRPLPHRFDNPTGLAAMGSALYVADNNGIWRVTGAGTPELLAGLTNVTTTGPHILRAGNTPNHIWLGLTTKSGTARLMRISTDSGEAELVDETQGELLDLSAAMGERPWTLLRRGKQTYLGPGFNLATPISAQDGTLAMPANLTDDIWPKALAQHALVSRSGSGDVMAVPFSLAQPLSVGRPIFSGFLSDSKRQVWGQVGPLYIDDRGAFITDSVNGDIWRIMATPPPKVIEPEAEPVITAEADESSEEIIIEKPRSKFSSSIESASTIKQGSTITKGSLMKLREEIAAEKAAAEEEAASKAPK